MKQFILKNKTALKGLAAALVIGAVTMSFQDSFLMNQKFDLSQNLKDTVPEKNFEGNFKMKDFDNLNETIEKSMEAAQSALKNIDLTSLQKNIDASLKNINMDEIMKNVQTSLKNIDLDKMMAEVKNSLKDINWKETEGTINSAMKEAQAEIEKAQVEIKNINTEEIKKEIENAKLEVEKSKDAFKHIDMDKLMKEAKEGADKAKQSLSRTKAMFTEMENDGLINTKDGFTIEYKDKDLYINNKKQSEQVTDKYRKYFTEGHFKITIDKD